MPALEQFKGETGAFQTPHDGAFDKNSIANLKMLIILTKILKSFLKTIPTKILTKTSYKNLKQIIQK